MSKRNIGQDEKEWIFNNDTMGEDTLNKLQTFKETKIEDISKLLSTLEKECNQEIQSVLQVALDIVKEGKSPLELDTDKELENLLHQIENQKLSSEKATLVLVEVRDMCILHDTPLSNDLYQKISKLLGDALWKEVRKKNTHFPLNSFKSLLLLNSEIFFWKPYLEERGRSLKNFLLVHSNEYEGILLLNEIRKHICRYIHEDMKLFHWKNTFIKHGEKTHPTENQLSSSSLSSSFSSLSLSSSISSYGKIELFHDLINGVYGTIYCTYLESFLKFLMKVSSLPDNNGVFVPPFTEIYILDDKQNFDWNLKDNEIQSLRKGDIVLVSDKTNLGIWWLKEIFEETTDKTFYLSAHNDSLNGKINVIESLEGQRFCRFKPPSLISKKTNLLKDIKKTFPVGLSVLYKDSGSRWVEGKVVEVTANRVRVSFSLNSIALLSEKTIDPFEKCLIPTPVDKDPRISAGLYLMMLLHQVDKLAHDVAQPLLEQPDVHQTLMSAVWQSVVVHLEKCEHIYARYIRVLLRSVVKDSKQGWTKIVNDRTEKESHFNCSGSEGLSSNSIQMGPRSSKSDSLVLTETHSPENETFSFSPIANCFQGFSTILQKKVFVELFLSKTRIYSRVFIQVFDAELRATKKWLLEVLESPRLDSKLLYEGICSCSNLNDQWLQIRPFLCPLEEINKISSTSNDLWINQAYVECDDLLQGLLVLLTSHAKNLLTNHCSMIFFSNVLVQDWSSCKAYFGDKYCTYGVQMWIFFLRKEYFLIAQYLKTINSPDKQQLASFNLIFAIAKSVFEETLAELSLIYMNILPSRARRNQYMMDLAYLLLGCQEIMISLFQIDPTRQWNILMDCDRILSLKVEEILCAIVSHLALVCGNCTEVLQGCHLWLECQEKGKRNKKFSVFEWIDNFRNILEIPFLNQNSKFIPYLEHSIMLNKEGFLCNKLGQPGIEWTNAISLYLRCSQGQLIRKLSMRHEIQTWEYPILTEQQKDDAAYIQEFIHQHKNE